ncbi:MAG: amidohydrolase family protein [Phycisphaerales bacterium]|nr:MAG: amidohydrolase family protein [Phycisphaerales bacterium]
MEVQRYTVCRAEFLLPLSEPDRARRIRDGYVLAEGETIREVGPYTPEVGRGLRDRFGSALHVLGADSSRVDRAAGAEGSIPRLSGVLMPAFVKAHGHDHEQPIIGVAKDEPLTSWLDHAVNLFTRFMSAEYESLRAELGCSPRLAAYRMARLCDIHYGITASMVHHCNHNKYHLEEVARANEAAGTTMIVAVGGQDRHYVEDLLDRPEEALGRLEGALRIGGLERTSFCPGPDQLFSNSREMLVPLKAWAREHDTLFHTHSSEEPKTTRWFREEIEPGMTPVEFAESIGILDEQSVLAHQVHCGPRDVEILARTGTKVVHNPLANTILGSGMPPLMEMLAAGITVAISTDGSGSADNQNILAAARLGAQYQRALHQDATLLPAQQLLEMITVVPASILRLNQGELAPGRQADWVLIDLNRPNMVPTRLDNLTENLIWAADGSEIDTVVARGRVLKEGGRVLAFLDGSTPERIVAAVRKLSERFAVYRASAPELKGTGAHR